MHIEIMRIKVSTEAAYSKLLSTPSFALTRDPRKTLSTFMNAQIDGWMESGYRKPRTKSDILDNRHHFAARKGTKI